MRNEYLVTGVAVFSLIFAFGDPKTMSRACSTCGSSDIDFDPSRGDTVCTNCGSVLEESVIVSEVTFQENSGGGSSVIGQFVSSEGNKVGQGLGFRPGFGRESRTITLENGKRRLQALANQLQLNNHCVESAYMFFKLAVSKRLTKGRRTNHVAAACLYLVCRIEKTSHLLLDFSDILQVDVMVLGRVYLKLQHELCINLPVIDPCLYIHRFAHQFQLEDKEQEVTNTALRLVSRMKRDWIQYGRRPSGLCGAALLVAARLHGFSRTVREVVKIVRLSKTTIQKRLHDFVKTPSGQLTVDEFNTIDLEEEQDPPSFTLGRQRLKQQQLNEMNGIDRPALTKELESLRREIERVLNRNKPPSSKQKIDSPLSSLKNNDNVDSSSLNGEVVATDEIAIEVNGSCEDLSINVADAISEADSLSTEKEAGEVTNAVEKENVLSGDPVNKDCTNNENEGMVDGQGPEPNMEETEDLGDVDDHELDNVILTAPEVEVKTKVWMEENKEYLEKLKEKEEREAIEKEREENDPNKKKRRKPYKKRSKEKANSVGEAVEKMLIEKKISNKINYDVLRNLNKENELEKPSQAEPEVASSEPVASLLQLVQPSIPVRYKGRKRDRNIPPCLPAKRVKFSDSVSGVETTASDTGVGPLMSQSDDKGESESVVVESGPVDYDDHEQEDLYDDNEEDVHLSAAQLMSQEYGQGEVDEYEDFDGF